jgi:hypothetical protein
LRWSGRLVVTVSLFAAIALSTGTSWGTLRVLLVADDHPGSPPAAPRGTVAQLRAELETAGFEVLVRTSGATDSAHAMEAAARLANAFAAITVFDTDAGTSADVWVTDRVTGKTLLRRVDVTDESPEANRILAIRAVELLEASLVELDLPRPQPPSPSSPALPPPASEKETGTTASPVLEPSTPPRKPSSAPIEPTGESNGLPPASPSFGLTLGMAALGGPGGLRANVAPIMTLSVRLSEVFSGEVGFVGPVRGSLESEIGSAEVDQELGTVRLRIDPAPIQQRLSAFAAVGLGIYRLGGSGTSSSPYAGAADSAWAAAVTGGVGGRVRVSRGFALALQLDGFFTAPRPAARFAESPVARAPAPGLLGALVGEVRF